MQEWGISVLFEGRNFIRLLERVMGYVRNLINLGFHFSDFRNWNGNFNESEF